MGVLSELEPKSVFHYFEEIAAIPHPSYQEKAISDYLVAFAKDHGLTWYQDKLFNVVMIKEATPGYENEEPIILQGHMDMVCEKDNGVTKDMEKEGLDLAIDGDYVYAKGTTLGGDDGIAVAYALALLDSDTLKHPRLEFVCTVSEEVGMEGAHGIDLSMLKGHRLINLDSEEEGYVLASCAGGGRAEVELPVERKDKKEDEEALCIYVMGLTGGHSGTEIHKGHASATQIAARLLVALSKNQTFRLEKFESGSKDNAIPREAEIGILLPKQSEKEADTILKKEAEAIQSEFSVSDPAMKIRIEPIKTAGPALTEKSTEQVLTMLLSLPNGVIRMSDNIKGLTETSLNMGITKLNPDHLMIKFAVRSSVACAYQALIRKVRFIGENLGGKVAVYAEYPAWEYRKESPLREQMSRIYREMFGHELVIQAIHAGVECGILAGKIKNLDAISMGPDMKDIHTPGERLSISSTERMYGFVRRLIEDK